MIGWHPSLLSVQVIRPAVNHMVLTSGCRVFQAFGSGMPSFRLRSGKGRKRDVVLLVWQGEERKRDRADIATVQVANLWTAYTQPESRDFRCAYLLLAQ